MPKVVFSRTLDKVTWKNTKLIKNDPAAEIRKMKKEPGPGMAILGSGSIVAQLAEAGLIDEFQIVVNPIVLGSGRTMFEGVWKCPHYGRIVRGSVDRLKRRELHAAERRWQHREL